MVNCYVLFEVRAEFLNNIYMSFGFKGLNTCTFMESLNKSSEWRNKISSIFSCILTFHIIQFRLLAEIGISFLATATRSTSSYPASTPTVVLLLGMLGEFYLSPSYNICAKCAELYVFPLPVLIRGFELRQAQE